VRFAATAAALLCAACSTQRTSSLAVVATPTAELTIDDTGPWREVPSSDAPDVVAEPVVPSAVPPARREEPAPRRTVTVPLRRTAAPPPPGTPPSKSAAGLARDRYVDHPTHVRAQRITFRCPANLAGEVRGTAERVVDEPGGRRRYLGRARVLCRELTLEADELILQVRGPDESDLQVTARGDVAFVSAHRDNVVEEKGLRSLLITNDRHIPLR
jgi:hypothetical protein